ncbi:MAG: PDDEXK nuclease domain-containing protein [Clostridia bacterium]|nr:PDDEXK nuclease domain-containing protein [Clostridia bacterium]
MRKDETNNVKKLVSDLKKLIWKKQCETSKVINAKLIELYWEMGEMICHRQEEYGWGKSVVEVLSNELKREFPDSLGYSAPNLWRMRNFYLTYCHSEKLAPLVKDLSWSNNLLIMEKCKDDLEKEFYIQMVRRYGWSKRTLTNFIENKTYEKYLLNQTNFDLTIPQEQKMEARLAVKDEYVFNFIDLLPDYSEYEMEQELIKHLTKFLSEMGDDFMFYRDRYHYQVDGRDFYIDLVLYHRILKSYVAIDLKIGDFEPEYAGKMQFYLSSLDKLVKLPEDNPSIGIIVCKNKNKTVVEYTLERTNAPMGVSTYQLKNTLPDNLKDMLPSPEEIANILTVFDKNDSDK